MDKPQYFLHSLPWGHPDFAQRFNLVVQEPYALVQLDGMALNAIASDKPQFPVTFPFYALGADEQPTVNTDGIVAGGIAGLPYFDNLTSKGRQLHVHVCSHPFVSVESFFITSVLVATLSRFAPDYTLTPAPL